LKKYAQVIDEDFGIELAEHTLLEMAKRIQGRTTPKKAVPSLR
jgi:hypothetical protein